MVQLGGGGGVNRSNEIKRKRVKRRVGGGGERGRKVLKSQGRGNALAFARYAKYDE